MRERYGMNTFGQCCLLARRLIESGTRIVQINWPKVANSDNHSWDVHVGLPERMRRQSAPMLDAGLSALITDMDERGLLSETLVVAVGEFGRSPLLDVPTLAKMGYRIVLFPLTAFRVAMKAAVDTLTELLQEGGQQASTSKMLTRAELYDLLGYTTYEARDRAYFGGTGNSGGRTSG